MNPLSQTPFQTNTYVEQEPEDALLKIRVVHLVPLQKKKKKESYTNPESISVLIFLQTKPSHAMHRLPCACSLLGTDSNT